MLEIKHPKLWHTIRRNLPSIKNTILKKEGLLGASFNELEGGFSNFVFLAKRSNKKFVIKLSADNAMPNEVYWYSMANRHRLSVPKLLSYDLSKEDLACMYEGLEYVEGGLPDWRSRSEMFKAGFFAGSQIKKMRSIGVDGFGQVDSKFRWTNKTWLGALKNDREAIDIRPALKKLTRRELDMIDDMVVFNKELDIRKPKLIHDDLYEMNVIRKGRGFVMIDPGFNIGGDPMYALSYSLVPRSRGFDEGAKEAFPASLLSENERYRLGLLYTYRLFKEMTEYIANKDSQSNINRLYKLLKKEMRLRA